MAQESRNAAAFSSGLKILHIQFMFFDFVMRHLRGQAHQPGRQGDIAE